MLYQIGCMHCSLLSKITLILDPSLIVYPQTIICTASVHVPPLVGMSTQVTLVWLVVVGQLPQFDARMLQWIVEHSGATSVQLKVIVLEISSITASLIFGGGKYSGDYLESKKLCNSSVAKAMMTCLSFLSPKLPLTQQYWWMDFINYTKLINLTTGASMAIIFPQISMIIKHWSAEPSLPNHSHQLAVPGFWGGGECTQCTICTVEAYEVLL